MAKVSSTVSTQRIRLP
jgi:hypothetical protein